VVELDIAKPHGKRTFDEVDGRAEAEAGDAERKLSATEPAGGGALAMATVSDAVNRCVNCISVACEIGVQIFVYYV
jgi:hypothetical protein